MLRTSFAALTAIFLSSGAAHAAQEADAQAKADVQKAGEEAKAATKDDKICKRVLLTGSRQKKLICQTTEEWGIKN